jgi:CheY-like chemotaxis protein
MQATNQHGTVLVVEDEDAFREAIVKMLRKIGFEVLESADGPSAIAHLGTEGIRWK